MSMSKVFGLKGIESKPRTTNQIWAKDVGYDEASWYHERMGLMELEDFLSVAGERIDYVKIGNNAGVEPPCRLGEAQD